MTTMVELSSSNLKSNVHSPGSIRPSERALAEVKLGIPPLLRYFDVKYRPLTSKLLRGSPTSFLVAEHEIASLQGTNTF